jgi:hypothetical protein
VRVGVLDRTAVAPAFLRDSWSASSIHSPRVEDAVMTVATLSVIA